MLLAGLRWLHLLWLLSLFGMLVFRVLVAPPALLQAPEQAPRLRDDLRRLAWGNLALTLAFGAAWFVGQGAAIAGTAGIGDTLAVLPTVAWDTRFGQIILLRTALLVLTAGLIGRSAWLACLAVGLALGLQGTIGHAGAIGGLTGLDLLISEALHLLAAGAWLGALLPLLRTLALLPAAAAATACRRFSPIGMAAVLVLACSGTLQGIALIGSVPALLGTAYGAAALAKLGLFGLMLILAIRNRLTLTDRLVGIDPVRARRALQRSILTETGLAACLVAAASAMASLLPARHAQPNWPFAWQPSLVALADPDLRQEVATALLATGLGIAAVTAATVWRRGRIVAWIFLAAVLVDRLPSLELLLVEAYPTSFYVSPTGFAAAGIVRGQALFATHCATCHGTGGAGDGVAAAGLRVHPADLTATHLLEHPDGDLFWWLTHGIEDPEGGMAMPGFADRLSEADRWAMIDFLRANNAGATLRRSGQWPQPVPAPALPVACADRAISDMSGLRRHAVEVFADVAGAPALPEIPPQDGVPVVRLHLTPTPSQADCSVETPDAWGAYAVLAGVPAGALAGTAFVIDPDGWLRAIRRAGDGPGWNDPALLIAEVRQICEHPLSNLAGGGHESHHP